MRVNSPFTGFFTNRLVPGSGIAILLLATFFITLSFTDPSARDLQAMHVNLIIRQIGHRLLLQAGDSTSRVLPVAEIKEGRFLLKFENEFVFSHDSLLMLSQGALPETEFPSGYMVTVHDCVTDGIVYGFQVNNGSPDLLPCRGRSQPPGCYTIEFAFPDFYKGLKQKKADVNERTEERKSVKGDPQVVNPKPEPFKKTSLVDGIDQHTEELKSVKTNPQDVNSNVKTSETTSFDFPISKMVYGSILLLLGITLLIGRFRKMSKPVLEQDQQQATTTTSVPELPTLGKFLFNAKGQRLLLGTEIISLTDKECKVLELLHKNFGELIPRETLMQEIWINEGVITGRSLDMFVSKLRKKLSLDPELRITNVHGKGYKLEIPS